MILDHYAARTDKASQYVDVEIPKVLEYVAANVRYGVNDPKGIQGDINNLSWDERTKISTRADADKQKALEARALEGAGDHKGSIQKWQEIFGGEFPGYG
jgi:hypothetical protein